MIRHRWTFQCNQSEFHLRRAVKKKKNFRNKLLTIKGWIIIFFNKLLKKIRFKKS